MAIQFQSLKLEDQELFGISLRGTVSRSDKSALQELAEQAMSRGKVKLVLDLKIYNLFDEEYRSILGRAMPGRNYLLSLSIKY